MSKIELTPISRRNFLRIVGGGSAALIATACSDGIPNDTTQQHQPQPPKPAAVPLPRPTFETPPTAVITKYPAKPTVEQKSTSQQLPELTLAQAEQILVQEVRKEPVSAEKQRAEQQLWQRIGSFRSATRIPINESSGQESVRRIEVVLKTMQQSQNWYLQDAGTFLSELISSGDLIFSFHPRLESQTLQKKAIMATGPELHEGKVRYRMFISIDDVLNENTSLSLALFLTHEAEHVGNMMLFSQNIPASATPEQELQSIASWKEDKEEYVKEEARGSGREALATIEAARFGLLRGWVKNSQMILSAMLIRSGKKTNTPEWISFVKEHELNIR